MSRTRLMSASLCLIVVLMAFFGDALPCLGACLTVMGLGILYETRHWDGLPHMAYGDEIEPQVSDRLYTLSFALILLGILVGIYGYQRSHPDTVELAGLIAFGAVAARPMSVIFFGTFTARTADLIDNRISRSGRL